MVLLPRDGHLPSMGENVASTLFRLKALNCLNEDYVNISNEATYFTARKVLLQNLDF